MRITETVQLESDIHVTVHRDKFLIIKPTKTKLKKLNSVALVRDQNIPTERPPQVGGYSAKICG